MTVRAVKLQVGGRIYDPCWIAVACYAERFRHGLHPQDRQKGLMDDLLTGRVRVGYAPAGLACLDAVGERVPGVGGDGQGYAVAVGRVAD